MGFHILTQPILILLYQNLEIAWKPANVACHALKTAMMSNSEVAETNQFIFSFHSIYCDIILTLHWIWKMIHSIERESETSGKTNSRSWMTYEMEKKKTQTIISQNVTSIRFYLNRVEFQWRVSIVIHFFSLLSTLLFHAENSIIFRE